MAIPRYPAHLEQTERKMWKKILSEYQIMDSAGLKILESALSAHQRCRQCREQIDREGMTYLDRFKSVKPHVLLASERDSRAAFLNAIKLLNLQIPTEG